ELWEAFARFGRVGDVYIPKKVDKWGRRFGFVKYRVLKETDKLCKRLQDVWIGTFHVRVNKSRFHRNEERRMSDVPVQPLQVLSKEEGEGSVQHGRSFKMALVQSYGVQEVRKGETQEVEEILQVEVDHSVLEELEQSYVGIL
ncbi:endonuclease/exonuclease/phosphatase family protein, partial [Trifolium medium]|nr:endonuclease/exonuclease/phosphatase family protein [Trifolium medium]